MQMCASLTGCFSSPHLRPAQCHVGPKRNPPAPLTPPPPHTSPLSTSHVGAAHVISYIHTKATVQRWWIIEGAKSSLSRTAPGLKLELLPADIRNKDLHFVDWSITVFLQTVWFDYLCCTVISLIECWRVAEECRTDRRRKGKNAEWGPSVRLQDINTRLQLSVNKITSPAWSAVNANYADHHVE